MKANYLRMIRGMKRSRKKEWSVYILRCRDGSLYTGIAKNPEARLAMHAAGEGAAYTRTRRPVEIVYKKSGYSRSGALIEEARIKRLSRSEKLTLIG